MAGIDLALDVVRDVADAIDVGDGGAAEFHHETGHECLTRSPGKNGLLHSDGIAVRQLSQISSCGARCGAPSHGGEHRAWRRGPRHPPSLTLDGSLTSRA